MAAAERAVADREQAEGGPGPVAGLRLGLTMAAAALALTGSQLKAVSFPASVALAAVAAAALAALGLLLARPGSRRRERRPGYAALPAGRWC